MRALLHLVMALAAMAVLSVTTPTAAATPLAQAGEHCADTGSAPAKSHHEGSKVRSPDCCLSVTVAPSPAISDEGPSTRRSIRASRPAAASLASCNWAADPPPPKTV